MNFLMLMRMILHEIFRRLLGQIEIMILVDFSRTFLNECNKKALINQKLNASQLQKQQWRDFL
jgi:hypothetical protein